MAKKMVMRNVKRAVFLHHQQRGSTESGREREESTTEAKLHPNQNLRFFSYGKQSLEVRCFYRGLFSFKHLSFNIFYHSIVGSLNWQQAKINFVNCHCLLPIGYLPIAIDSCCPVPSCIDCPEIINN
jgi:hypothetical protein